MFSQRRSVFRRESLERLSSPERLDQLMQVVAPKDWLGLMALGSLLLLGLGWSILGKIPIVVTGRGVLTNPYQVTELQSFAVGRLQSWTVKVGDRVRQGDILGVVDQSELQEQLRQQQKLLTTLQGQDQQIGGLSDQRLALDRQVIQEQRQEILQHLQDGQSLAPVQRSQTLKELEQQRQALALRLQNAQALDPILKDRLAHRKQLQAEGAIATDAVLEAERSYRENMSQIATLKTELQALESHAIAAERLYREELSQTANLQTKLKQLDSQVKSLTQQSLEATTTRQNQILTAKQTIAALNQQLQTQGQIRSPANGRVLEVSVAPGQVLSRGIRLGIIEAEHSDQALVSLLYFPIKDGKQLRAGMTVQITPDNIKREQFGSLLGKLESVSPFPVTRQSIATAIGSNEIAAGLTFNGGQVGAIARLQLDPTSQTGYRWSSSKSPDLSLSAGTTVSVRVILGEQPPIAFVLPMLRSITGSESF